MQLLLSMPGGAEWILILVVIALLLTYLSFWVYTIVDVAKSKFNDDITKIVWLLVVILLGFLGSIIYWIVGRSSKKNLDQK